MASDLQVATHTSNSAACTLVCQLHKACNCIFTSNRQQLSDTTLNYAATKTAAARSTHPLEQPPPPRMMLFVGQAAKGS
jgi:hypothetical protein